MRYIFSLIVLLSVAFSATAQQINPVPDYIFRNQMSVGRNAPTDTAAYLSIGPRFGANRGIMPPMVVDTNAVTGVKRNGLLIFSVQLNNFAYWDSTTSRFRKITAEAVVDSVLFATRAWRKKGDDSLAAIINTRTDTALLSTKAYRQKGVDSLVTLISTLGGGTVLSVSAGTGMNFTTITTSGSVNADTNVLATRVNRDKLKDSLNANIALKVNISDTSTMLGAYLRKADTTAMLSPYVRKGDTTAMLAPYVRIAGFGLTKGTQTLSVDSALIATRARVQKGIDSVASLVTTTDSLLFSTRAWRQKGVDSVAALANTKATATGTTNYLSKFTGTSSLGNSIVYATTSEVGISTPSPTHPLDVNGRVRVRTIDSTATGINMLYADNDGVIKKAAVPAGGSGTVTSVGSGFGTNFSTITSTGSVVVDSVVMATRARVQKAVDSLGAVKGSGTVTSVGPGYGTNFNTISATGNVAVDSVIIASRARVQKAVDSLGSVKQNTLTNPVTGTGTTNYVPKFTGTSAIGNSQIFDNGTNVGIGTTSPDTRLSVIGDGTGIIRMGSGVGGNSATIGLTGAISSTNYTLSGDAGNSNLAINRPTGGAMSFRSNGSAQMTLTSAGRLLVGTETEGTNTVDINGTLRTVNGANFATSSGSVGIGTTSPAGVLQTNGTGDQNIYFSHSDNSAGRTVSLRLGTSNSGFRDRSTFVRGIQGSGIDNYALAFGTTTVSDASAQERMRITGTGNVGIGTTSPSEVLHVVGRGRFTTIDSTSSPINMLWADNNGVIRKAAVPTAASVDTNSIATRARVQKAVDSINNVNASGTGISGYINRWSGSKTMDTSQIFQQANRIGIGTTTPDARLVVVGDGTGLIRLGGGVGGNTASIGLTGAISSTAYTLAGDPGTGNVTLNRPSGGALSFAHANTEQARFDGNGTFLINTTTSDANVRLRVNGRARVETIDSSASPINMLWADNTGVIRKAPVASGGLTGSGTTDFIPKFTGSTAVGNSILKDSSSHIVVNGRMRINTSGQLTTFSNFYGSGTDGFNIFIGGGGNSSTIGGGASLRGSRNIALGTNALLNNTTGYGNTSIGHNSMYYNESGYGNAAIGGNALAYNTTGLLNAAMGGNSMFWNTTGSYNSAYGHLSLFHNTTGSNNIAIGNQAGTFTASDTNRTSSNSIYIGSSTRSLANGDTNEIVIGYNLTGNGSNTTTIGNAAITKTFISGALDIGTIDSTASAINMLYADANGVIKKAAIGAGSFTDSVKMRSTTLTASGSWTLARSQATPIDQVVKFLDLSGLETIKVNGAFYLATSSMSYNTWLTIGSVPSGFRPTNDIYQALPPVVDGSGFENSSSASFTGQAIYSAPTSMRIKLNGDIDIYMAGVSTSVEQGGTDYVLIPVAIAYPILPILN